MNRQRVRVLVVDDSRAFREWVCQKLKREAHYEIVGEAADAAEALQKARGITPDLILLDIGLPGVNGIEVQGQLSTIVASARIVVLNHCSDQHLIQCALSNGARGYILKTDAKRELLPALDAALRGGKFLSSGCYQRQTAMTYR